MILAITGGAGFLAYHLCNKLRGRFEKFLLLDIAPVDLKEYPPNTTYVCADVRSLDQLNENLQGVDLLVHGAAALPLWSRKDIYDINVLGTRNVLESAKKNGIKRVVHISSTAVYGVPKKHPIKETDPMIGVGPYGQSKIEAEKICEEYRRQGMCVPVVRPKTFVGEARLGVFQILYDWIKNGKKIPIIGNGKNRYQLLEVEDLVDAIFLLLCAPEEKVNDTFNIAAERFDTVLEDVGALCAFSQTNARVMPTPAWPVKVLLSLFEKAGISPLYPWVYKTADKDSFVSIDKIKELGWSPQYSNAEALIRSYQWYLEHCGEISDTGITHRTAWKQGVLGFFKRFL